MTAYWLPIPSLPNDGRYHLISATFDGHGAVTVHVDGVLVEGDE